MSSSPSSRVREIVVQARGNRSHAERLIRDAIAHDPQFLRQLVEPFLPGIIAHALSRETTQAAQTVSKPLSEIGMEALMRGLGSKVETHAAAASGKLHTGSGHADTIRALAEAQKRRRDRA